MFEWSRPDICLGSVLLITMSRNRFQTLGPSRAVLLAACFAAIVLGIDAVSVAQAGVLINELHYKPALKTDRTEFVELYNTESQAILVSGWRLEGGVEYVFPEGAVIPGRGYVVVGEYPSALKLRFGVAALGAFRGRLSQDGERLVLRGLGGALVDEVNYKGGFPWPTLTGDAERSIELVHPAFDNDLGGHWRPSAVAAIEPASVVIPKGDGWLTLKGTAAALPLGTSWRSVSFDDSQWIKAKLPLGYGENFIVTTLADMRSGYTSVLFRKIFVVEDPAKISGVLLAAQYDDGLKVWINGKAVASVNMPEGEVGLDGTALAALEDANFKDIPLVAPVQALVKGVNVIAVQGFNSSLAASSDFFVDMILSLQQGQGGTGGKGPTPGRQNSVYSSSLPPAVRQVNHEPQQPASAQRVLITAKITDPRGVRSARLEYQMVDPGAYVELSDAAYRAAWTAVDMNDAGLAGDATAADGVYAVTLGSEIQKHRRLVRYRIRAVNGDGAETVAPFAEDPQPNFAYFVYDGVPAWNGSVIPGVGTVPVTYGTNLMRRFPVYHLISKRDSVETATWKEKYGGDLYKWWGTLVYDGVVYDHIRYRARGGVWRYAMGKNMWKFDFNPGHDFQGRDNYGRKYGTQWSKLNLGACIQQGDFFHRGEQGMFESVGFRLFQMAGVEAPRVSFVQFRIIDDQAESSAQSQYEGDFWGLYLALEQEDGRFLDEHGMPDGNLYKMEGGTGELNNLGLAGPSDKTDLNGFIATYRGGNVTDAWWRTNLNLGKYYSYRAIVEAIHHYDIDEGAGKNYFYYRNPATGLWSVHPWDLDLTWSDNMYGGGQEPFKSRVLANTRPSLVMEYRNRVRELRDLLFNADETGKLIDEYAAMIRDPAGGPSFIDPDRSQWDFNPVMRNTAIVNSSKAGQGRFYQAGVGTKDFNGMIAKMKAYVNTRGAFLDSLARDTAIPQRPILSVQSSANFPVNRIVLGASTYAGSAAFAAMQWRLAEISGTNLPAFDPAKPRKYEIEPVWESGELTNEAHVMTLPPDSIKVGRSYRTRVRMKDVTGRWSQWSQPVEFVAGEPEQAGDLKAFLRISEIHYHAADSESFEFVELKNISTSATLDLNGVKISGGIDFDLQGWLVPGAFLVVANTTPELFRARYRMDPGSWVQGPFAGKLDHGGETLRLRAAAGGAVIEEVAYDDDPPWPTEADGKGSSLNRIDFGGDGSLPGSWVVAAPSPGGGVGSVPGGEIRLSVGLSLAREVLVKWNGVMGNSYSVQYRETVNSAQAPWLKFFDVDAAAVASPSPVELSVRDVVKGTAGERYYRVVSPKVQ